MQNKYLVAVDGRAGSHRAMDHALARAKVSGAGLALVHVIEWSPYSFHTAEELAERHGRREEELSRAQVAIVDPFAARAAQEGVAVETVTRHGRSAETISDIARELDVAQVIVGRSGETGVKSVLFGAVTTKLAQTCPVPVLIVP